MIKMKQDDLKIYYKDEEGINVKLDLALEKVLNEFGYKRWASGIGIDGIRDIAFDKEVNND